MSDNNNKKDDQGLQRALKFLPVALAFAAIVTGWSTLGADNYNNKTNIAENKASITRNGEDLKKINDTVIRIEEKQKAVQENQKEIGRDIKNILRVINSRGTP